MDWNTIGGIASAIGNSIGALSPKMQYKYQSKLQQQQQNWLENMSNTAHVREMRDLRNAGINPLLTIMGGNGASTPASGMGNISAPEFGNPIESGISTAMQMRQQKNADQQSEAQVKNLNAQTDTEATKQQLNIADTQLKISENLLKREDLSSYQKRLAAELKESASRTVLNLGTATARQKEGQAALMQASTAKEVGEYTKKEKEAQTKYQNERSRGYNIYDFDSYGKGFEGIGENLKMNLGKNPWR